MNAAGWRIVLLASLGGTLEFYDFVIFGIFARDIADAFFPSGSPLVSLMASFAAFAAGYWTAQRSPTQSYISQAEVVSGVALAASVKIAVATYQSENGQFPSSNAQAHLPAPERLTDRYVSSIAIGPQGIITVTYKNERPLSGRTLVIAPTLVEGTGLITWSCSGGTLPAELRPEMCR